MDSVSSPELAGIFVRVGSQIDLGGATNAWEISERMRHACDVYRAIVEIERLDDKPRKSRIKHFGYMAEQLDKLIEHGFPERVIFEANKRPKGYIAQTLLYGSEKARKRVAAYRRARIAAYEPYGVRPRWPTPPRVPETRRRYWWRR